MVLEKLSEVVRAPAAGSVQVDQEVATPTGIDAHLQVQLPVLRNASHLQHQRREPLQSVDPKSRK